MIDEINNIIKIQTQTMNNITDGIISFLGGFFITYFKLPILMIPIASLKLTDSFIVALGVGILYSLLYGTLAFFIMRGWKKFYDFIDKKKGKKKK